MKKILYILVASLALFSACDNSEDAIFDKSPEERLSSVLSEYKTNLTQNDGYWIAYYSGNAILMKFKSDNTVEFKSTYNQGKDDRTITFRVGASQVPELVFENYSVFQALYEDNRSTGEFEFLFDTLSEDKIQFISKTDLGKEKTKLTFFKSKPEDIETAKAMITTFNKMSFFKKVTVEGSSYEAELIIFPESSSLRIPLEDGKFQILKYDYEITKDGLLFPYGIEIDGTNVEYFYYDADNKQYSADVDGKKITISINDNAPEAEAGIFDKYMSVNRRDMKNTSYSMNAVTFELRKKIPLFSAMQLYSEWGHVLCYAPETAGSNWSGLTGYTFAEMQDKPDNLLITTDGPFTFGPWWRDVYFNDGGKMLLSFLSNPKGLYITKYDLNSFILVSNTDPSQYILVE